MSLLRFHHNALAVTEPNAAFAFLALQGYIAGRRLFDPSQSVNLAMWHHSSAPDFEVIWSGDRPSPIDGIVKQHGPLIYHVCYETNSREEAVAFIEDAGLSVIPVGPEAPAPLFDGRQVSFHLVDGFGLVELLAPS